MDSKWQGGVRYKCIILVVSGSKLDELPLVFALQRSQSDELEAHPRRASDLHQAPMDQHLKPGTHIPPNFPRFRKQGFHRWSSTYYLVVRQISLHCQGVDDHNGTAWIVFGSMPGHLAIDFA